MSKANFILFLVVVISIYFLIHYFVFVRIVKGLALSPRFQGFLKIFFLFCASAFFLDKFLSRHLVFYPVAILGSVWLGIISIGFTIFIFQNLLVFILPLLSRSITIVSILLVFFISSLSLYNAAVPARIKEIEIPIEGLPCELEGFSIVQLSDLHLEGWKSTKWLRSVVDSTNKLAPDVIVVTGDLIDRNIDGSQKFCEILRQLKSKYGVFAVTGNHEYYAGIESFLQFSKKAGIRVLRNNTITIADGIEIIGVDDETGEAVSGVGLDLESILKDNDLKRPKILLSHRPRHFEEAVDRGVDLQLSGHVHAGQIPPMDLIVFLVYKYPYGLYRYKTSFIYTTSGTGTWGPPMRLFSRSEIVKIVLIERSCS